MVQERVQSLMAARSNRTQITADTILSELHSLATVDITEAFDSMGGLKPLTEIRPEVRKAISHLEVSELFSGQGDEKTAIGLNKRIKFHDKGKALELLGRHLKLFTDKIQITQESVEKMTDEELVALARQLLKDHEK